MSDLINSLDVSYNTISQAASGITVGQDFAGQVLEQAGLMSAHQDSIVQLFIPNVPENLQNSKMRIPPKTFIQNLYHQGEELTSLRVERPSPLVEIVVDSDKRIPSSDTKTVGTIITDDKGNHFLLTPARLGKQGDKIGLFSPDYIDNSNSGEFLNSLSGQDLLFQMGIRASTLFSESDHEIKDSNGVLGLPAHIAGITVTSNPNSRFDKNEGPIKSGHFQHAKDGNPLITTAQIKEQNVFPTNINVIPLNQFPQLKVLGQNGESYPNLSERIEKSKIITSGLVVASKPASSGEVRSTIDALNTEFTNP